MRFENQELRTFKAVVEANGFNRAAERLHVSQSAVSQAIASLEGKLDVVLLVRGKQMTLTEAGRRLLDYANEVLNEEQQVLEDIAHLKHGARQSLNLAINSTINLFYAPQLLSQFNKSQRATQIKVTELPSRNLIYTVLAGKADLALGPFQKHMDAFTTVPLFRENRYLVVSPNHPEHRNILTGDSRFLKETTLITSFLDTPEMRPSMQRLRDRFRNVWEVSSISLRVHLVNQGLGVAYIDSKLLEEHAICREFSKIPGLPWSMIARDVGIYYKSGRILSSASLQFIDLCREFWKQQSTEPAKAPVLADGAS